MDKKEALDKFDPLRGSDAIYDFIERLYKENYIITKQQKDKKFICPSCERTWDLNKHDACQCGAVLDTPKNRGN